tara:strand:- start:238 stop:654 length:417 start_codon:yes stop_codon:yes gene_type:complete
MALVGGGVGGASNTVNPAGTGSTFNYIGNHVYMNTGRVDFDGTETTVAETTTGDAYIVGKLTCAVEADGSDDIRIRLYFNEEQIMGDISTSPPGTGNLAFNPLRVIIPPYTKVKITYDNEGSSATRTSLTMFTGRVYA